MIVGITGGIGSGKSTIARALAERGYAVYDCDREAKRIIAENKEVQAAIIKLLGEEAFVNGGYNTAYVAKRVFEDSHLLAALNAIVHPAVKADIIQRAPLSSSATSPCINPPFPSPFFLESAILYEAGLDALCDRIIVVDAPEEIRIARTITRDYKGDASSANIEKVRARICAQESTPTVHHTPYTILNDGLTPIDDLVDNILQNL